MIRPLIAGNWKMNKTIGESVDFTRGLRAVLQNPLDRDVIVAPPFTALSPVAEVLKGSGIYLAAQNMYEAERGAFTGEVSARMLCDAGCQYVIVGHSERRHIFSEDDEFINRKIKIALKFGLKPIFCVGETLEERESGITYDVLQRQIGEGLNNVSADDIRSVVIAYEPVWAIGTGRTATPEQAEDAHKFIRLVIQMFYDEDIAGESAILYGGSVNPDNIRDLMAQDDVNGVLVGGASLNLESFTKIIKY